LNLGPGLGSIGRITGFGHLNDSLRPPVAGQETQMEEEITSRDGSPLAGPRENLFRITRPASRVHQRMPESLALSRHQTLE
jgi:hypothetical protein